MSEKKRAKKSTATKTDVRSTVRKVVANVKKVVSKEKDALAKLGKKTGKPSAAAMKSVSAKEPKVSSKASPKAVASTRPSSRTVTSKNEARANVAKTKPAAPKKASASSRKPAPKAAESHSFSPEYLVLMQRDPNWMHAFWDVSEKRIKDAVKGKSRLVLRLYDVSSDLTVRRSKLRKFRDVEIPADARSWYVQNLSTDNYSASLGALDASGKFSPIVSAAPMSMFSFEGLEAVDGDNPFFKASLGGASIGGFGSSGLSSPSAKSWLEQLASSSESFFSGILSSGALAQQGPDTVSYGKDFFLWVKTRLIVYGGTRPDAHLEVRGEPFPLNPDGTFSLEMDLPDSTQVIPVFATDKDGDFPTTIVPIVVKRTE